MSMLGEDVAAGELGGGVASGLRGGRASGDEGDAGGLLA